MEKNTVYAPFFSLSLCVCVWVEHALYSIEYLSVCTVYFKALEKNGNEIFNTMFSYFKQSQKDESNINEVIYFSYQFFRSVSPLLSPSLSLKWQCFFPILSFAALCNSWAAQQTNLLRRQWYVLFSPTLVTCSMWLTHSQVFCSSQPNPHSIAYRYCNSTLKLLSR